MGYLCNGTDSGLKAEATLAAPVSMKAQAAFQNLSVSNKKRDRQELASEETQSVSFPLSAPGPICSDDSEYSSSDEETPDPRGFAADRGTHRGNGRICKKKRRRNQKVDFGDLVSTTVYHASNVTQAELRELKHLLWFTKQDRLRSQAECQRVLKAFRVQNAQEVTQFSAVYRTSMEVPFSQASSDFLEQATISVPLIIRGMEWGIAPKLKKRRREHIQNILTAQKEIRDTELRERFVSSRSLQSSRPARIMARIIGEGDVSSARGITSTALDVKTIPLATSVGEHTPRSLKATPGATNKNSTVKGPKIGHSKRRRRPVLWRNYRGKGITTQE
mmetsp:Transcript_26891/g.73927  ORF Transcript_26891/g.73927 Transcript_26891/m.73927 type:complete len:333 (+) Transcript_26891:152-1150(+)|eukprot:CAMPEP_0172356430 /NCGR_PEP_ID=MMETSP1060-20121228/774_1 /TAXON_ID=37318 /ORGANISM="Pseudo-nitzschia pungens, Strain cf. cingulata" /LENGTH=332 /DNA_ID=CAMNT_0013076507 /DNA_START=146 /DNA_END=1144 /DNA_ORIENTATION=+